MTWNESPSSHRCGRKLPPPKPGLKGDKRIRDRLTCAGEPCGGWHLIQSHLSLIHSLSSISIPLPNTLPPRKSLVTALDLLRFRRIGPGRPGDLRFRRDDLRIRKADSPFPVSVFGFRSSAIFEAFVFEPDFDVEDGT